MNSRLAIVTGAASGIGRSTAETLNAAGWHVIGVDLDGERLDGDACVPVRADVTDAGDCRRVAHEARRIGGLRRIVNCAGLQLAGTVVTLDEDAWDRVLAVNLKAIFLLSRALLPLMTNGSAVVNVSSVQGLATQRDVAAYAAAKGGAIALTRAMALDHAQDGIRVNCVCPGTIDTPLSRAGAAQMYPDDPERALAEWGEMTALGRVGRPEEVAALIEFLLSDRAGFCTGATYLIEGGILASYA